MPDQTIFEQRMDAMADELREVRGALSEVAKALTKLSVLEERNVATIQTIEKIAARQEKFEGKLAALELEQVRFASNASGVATAMKLMWGAFGGGLLYVASELIKNFGR